MGTLNSGLDAMTGNSVASWRTIDNRHRHVPQRRSARSRLLNAVPAKPPRTWPSNLVAFSLSGLTIARRITAPRGGQ